MYPAVKDSSLWPCHFDMPLGSEALNFCQLAAKHFSQMWSPSCYTGYLTVTRSLVHLHEQFKSKANILSRKLIVKMSLQLWTLGCQGTVHSRVVHDYKMYSSGRGGFQHMRRTHPCNCKLDKSINQVGGRRKDLEINGKWDKIKYGFSKNWLLTSFPEVSSWENLLFFFIYLSGPQFPCQ